MVFYFLISVVFIAELIITAAIVLWLVKSGRKIRETNSFLTELKPKLKDIMILCRQLSEQITDLAPIITEKIKSVFWNILAGHLKSALAGLTFWAVKTEVEKHISK